MKFFHLSDLHIGKQLHHYNLKEDQQYVLEQILQKVKEEAPDAVLICGDIYDSAVPSAEAVAILDDFLTKLSKVKPQPVILMIAGNHDNGKRLSYANRILTECKIYVEGIPPMKPEERMQKVTLEDAEGLVDFYLLPFTKPSYVRGLMEEQNISYHKAVSFLIEREEIDDTRRNVILSHQFYVAGDREPMLSDSELHTVGGLDQVDISALSPFDYAALGHIHRSQKMGKESIRYCGTLLPYSISEAEDEKSLTVVTLGKKGTKPIIDRIPLIPLRKVRKLRGTLLEVLEAAGDIPQEDYVSITLTDDIDPYYPKERLEELYQRILEIRIDNERTRKVMDFAETTVESVEPGEAFQYFFEEMNGREMTQEEYHKIQEIILKCQEEIQ